MWKAINGQNLRLIDAIYELLDRTAIAKECFHPRSNDDGLRFVNLFAVVRELAICNTFAMKRRVHRIWH